VYASILARKGYRVELIDVVPLLVEDEPAPRAVSSHLLVVGRKR
jgi:hypothetical protein